MSLGTRIAANERRKLVLRHMESNPLFQDMAARQGINLAGRWWDGLESMLLRALGRCSHCQQKKACLTWLRRPAPDAVAPAFCPNSRVLEACRVMDPGASAHSSQDQDREPSQPRSLTELLDDPLVRLMKRSDCRPRLGWLLDVVRKPRLR